MREAVPQGRIELHFLEASPARRSRALALRPGSCTSRPSVMISPTVMRGDSEP